MFGSCAPSKPNFFRVTLVPFTEIARSGWRKQGLGFRKLSEISDLSAFNYLKEAKPARSNIPRSIGMEGRRSFWHQDPVFTAYMCGQSCPNHCRHTHGRVVL